MLKQYIIISILTGILLSAGSVSGVDTINQTPSATKIHQQKPTDLRIWGDEASSTSIYVFSSLTCPHCAVFHAEVFPVLKKTFIDSGQAKLIYVDMPYESRSMTGTLLARCIEQDLYEPFMDTLFKNQRIWAYHDKPRTLMEEYARVLGADVEKLNACVTNEDLRRTVTQQRNNLSTLYKVTGMPTLIVIKEGTSHKITGTDTEVIITEIKSIMGEK